MTPQEQLHQLRKSQAQLKKRRDKHEKALAAIRADEEREVRERELRRAQIPLETLVSEPTRLLNLAKLERSCFRKCRYDSQAIAMKVIAKRKFAGQSYFCPPCGGWHIAKKRKRKKKKKVGDVAEPGRLQRIANP